MLKMPHQTTHFTEGNSDDQKVRLTAQEHTAYNYRVKIRARTSSLQSKAYTFIGNSSCLQTFDIETTITDLETLITKININLF